MQRLNESNGPLPWQDADWQQVVEQHASARLPHAQLLVGEQGIGKYEFALSLAQYLLCSQATENSPCGRCRSCVLFTESQHPDLQLVAAEEGKQQIGVDQIRVLLQFLANSSHAGGAKLVIINDVHKLNSNAANALLKTLEEPSQDSYLILLTPYPGRLMATIRSRCQLRHFESPGEQVSREWLRAKLSVSNEDLEELMQLSRGRPLQVLANSESGLLQERREVNGALMAVLNRKAEAFEVVVRSKKWTPSLAVEMLSENLSALLKVGLGVQNPGPIPTDILQASESLYAGIDSRSKEAQGISKSLLDLYTKCEVAKKQLQSSTNPNPQLLLEDLLWQWRNLR